MVNQKAALERLWKDRCTVTVREEVTDSQTKITDFQEVALFQDKACKLSFQTLTSANGGEVATAEQLVTLFLSSELLIPPGSKITVTHQGRVMEYSNSGEPGVFTYHQEIRLDKFRGWA